METAHLEAAVLAALQELEAVGTAGLTGVWVAETEAALAVGGHQEGGAEVARQEEVVATVAREAKQAWWSCQCRAPPRRYRSAAWRALAATEAVSQALEAWWVEVAGARPHGSCVRVRPVG